MEASNKKPFTRRPACKRFADASQSTNSLLLTQTLCRLLFAFHVIETHRPLLRRKNLGILHAHPALRFSLCDKREMRIKSIQENCPLWLGHCALGHKEIARHEIRAQKGITAAASCNRHFELCEPFNSCCCWTNNFHCFRRSGASRRNHCAPFFEIFLRGSTHKRERGSLSLALVLSKR